MLAELFAISPGWSASFLLVLGRLTAAFAVMPIFGTRGVPPQATIGLALILSLVVLPLQQPPPVPVPTDLLPFAAQLGSEVIVGLALGTAVLMVFQALEMGASLVGVQMGFGMAGVVDPMTGAQSGVMEQLYRLIAALVFFAVQGHLLVVSSLVDSFALVPPGTADLSLIAGDRAALFFAELFAVAVRIALPVAAALLLAEVALGLVARTVPQMNILIVGFPAKIAVGLVVIVIALPAMTSFMSVVFGRALLEVNGLLAV